jgi:peptidoglycan/LPS O-acetylase OafA/YrhL
MIAFSQTYRKDIDGLRAISVFGVILFHYGFTALPGGFTGVDVFFVISGFLITGLLLTDVARGRSPILSFYDRRIRRIFPALLLVVAVSLAAGWFLQLPGDFSDTAESARYAVFGLSNFYFLANTGYFDQTADLLVFLHTWSLAVEEQFYLIWPWLIFLIAFGFGRRTRPFAIAMILVIVLSFALNLYLTATAPKTAFYMLPGRAWELALGALLLFPPRLKGWTADIADALGVALIAAGFLVIHETDAFPGFLALYPCVGAALIIWPKNGSTIVGGALGRLSPVGKISYSLYLWHWPILVYFKFYNNNLMPSAYEAGGLVTVTLAFSVLSWRFVEQPFRRVHGWKVAAGVVGAAVAAFCIGTVILKADGFPGRLPPEVAALQSLKVMWRWDCQRAKSLPGLKSICIFGAPWAQAANKGFLWGDSHAQHMAPLLEPLAQDTNFSVILYKGCPAYLDGAIARRWRPDMPKYMPNCVESWSKAVTLLQRHPEINTVILSAAWSHAISAGLIYQKDPSERSAARGLELLRESLNALIDKIEMPGRHIVLIGEVPEWPHDPVPCELASAGFLRRTCTEAELLLSSAAFDKVLERVNDVFRGIADARPDVTAVLPAEALCGPRYCLSKLDGEPLYRDGGHIRRNLKWPTKIHLAHLIGLDAVFPSTRQRLGEKH